MSLFRRIPIGDGVTTIWGPGEPPLRFLGLHILRLPAGASEVFHSGEREQVLVILQGRCNLEVQTAAGEAFRWEGLGSRTSVFDGPATAAYVPAQARFTVTGVVPATPSTSGNGTPFTGAHGTSAHGGGLRNGSLQEPAVEIAICSAPGEPTGQPEDGGMRSVDIAPYVVRPEEVAVNRRGKGAFQRVVHDLIPATRPAASLVVGETFNLPGMWSSYPPHKHDVHNPPQEVEMEEVYLFRVSPEQGFGVQALYTGQRDMEQAFIIRHNDSVALPRGYHPVAAAPGYRLYYLWLMAGRGRVLRPNDDPAHAWVHQAEV